VLWIQRCLCMRPLSSHMWRAVLICTWTMLGGSVKSWTSWDNTKASRMFYCSREPLAWPSWFKQSALTCCVESHDFIGFPLKIFFIVLFTYFPVFRG
jgi:hypothetical protein